MKSLTFMDFLLFAIQTAFMQGKTAKIVEKVSHLDIILDKFDIVCEVNDSSYLKPNIDIWRLCDDFT